MTNKNDRDPFSAAMIIGGAGLFIIAGVFGFSGELILILLIAAMILTVS